MNKKNKSETINFRVTEKEKQEILKLAYERGLTITDLFMHALENYKIFDFEIEEIFGE